MIDNYYVNSDIIKQRVKMLGEDYIKQEYEEILITIDKFLMPVELNTVEDCLKFRELGCMYHDLRVKFGKISPNYKLDEKKHSFNNPEYRNDMCFEKEKNLAIECILRNVRQARDRADQIYEEAREKRFKNS